MNITRNNYEVYFIDHFDGKLDAVQTAELFLFLDANPDLKEEFESFADMPVDMPEETFSGKQQLIRGEVNASNAEHYFIAELEGDLSPDEKKSLARFLLQHPEFEKQRVLFGLTKLPAEVITYPGKATLRQPVPIGGWFTGTVRYAVAAAIVLLLISGSYLVFNTLQKDTGIQMANEAGSPTGVEQVVTAPSAQNAETPSATDENNTVPAEPLQKEAPAASQHLNPVKIQLQASPQQMAEVKSPVQSDSTPSVSAPQSLTPAAEEQQITEAPPVAMDAPAQLLASAAPSRSELMTLGEAVRKKAGDELAKVSGNTGAREMAAVEGKPKTGAKLLGMIGKGLQKVAGDKVSLTTAYDVDGQMMAYDFKAAGISIEKK